MKIAQAGEPGFQGEVAGLRRVVALQRGAGLRTSAGDARQNRIRSGNVEGGRDQARDGGQVDARAARILGVEHDGGREFQLDLGGLGLGQSLRADDRYRIGLNVETILGREGEPRRGGLGGSREGSIDHPDRLEGAEPVEGLHRLPILRAQAGEKRGRIGETSGQGRPHRIGRHRSGGHRGGGLGARFSLRG